MFSRIVAPSYRRWAAVNPEVPVTVGPDTVFRAELFPKAGPLPWLDRPDAEHLVQQLRSERRISATEAELAHRWIHDGYLILEGFFDADELDRAWAAYERAIEEGRLVPPASESSADDPLPGRVLNPHDAVPEFAALLRHRKLLDVVELLIGAETQPFQTIAGHKGSQQLEHSDSIHMTSYPMGYLAASWTAFEDISPESGPLVYYPGSHRLPYVLSHNVGITVESFRDRGYADYHARYEPAIQDLIKEHGLERHLFMARKGDVLLWHANLLHGGSMRQSMTATRRALVCHYFARGCINYHDLAASRARTV